MSFEDLEKNADGTIKTSPLVGFQTGTPAGTSCFLRLLYVSSEDQLQAYFSGDEAIASSVQLILHPNQALELSESLATAARKALMPPTDGTPIS